MPDVRLMTLKRDFSPGVCGHHTTSSTTDLTQQRLGKKKTVMTTSHSNTHPSHFFGWCQPCEIVMMNSLGCDKHTRAQGARREEGVHITHSITVGILARGVWTVPSLISPPTRTEGLRGCWLSVCTVQSHPGVCGNHRSCRRAWLRHCQFLALH